MASTMCGGVWRSCQALCGRQGEGVVLSAAEPDVAGEGCPGSGDGDVGDE